MQNYLSNSMSREEASTMRELGTEEYKRLKYAFDALDPDKTGSIEAEDLISFMRCNVKCDLAYGIIMDKFDLNKMLDSLNLDEDVTRVGKYFLVNIRLDAYIEIF